MSFARPLVLVLLAAPVLLAAWETQRRGLPLILPFDHGLEHRAAERLWRIVITGSHVMPYALLSIAILLLAGPRRPTKEHSTRVMNNIEFCLDVSGSMGARFGDGSRYDAAMAAISEFTTYRKGDAFGLTIFGTEVLHWVPLTKDTSAIRMAAPFLGPDKMPQYFGGTRIGRALRACLQALSERREGDRLIILVSDGHSADLGGGEAQTIAGELRAENVVVYLVHVGGSNVPGDMYTIAGTTRGEVFAVGDPSALDEVFRHIDSMRPARLKPAAAQYADCFAPFAVAGLGVLALYVLTMFGLRYTPW